MRDSITKVLTPFQFELARTLATTDKPMKQIADDFNVVKHTIADHRSRICKKLGTDSRLSLAQFWGKHHFKDWPEYIRWAYDTGKVSLRPQGRLHIVRRSA